MALSRWTLFAGNLLAGLSVAAILLPQALAYAELAGLPAYLGLYAAAVAPIAAAFFASSPFLQTGPTALTALLTLGILSSIEPSGSLDLISAAALLALVVGITRITLGLLRFGGIAFFMSRPVLQGFTSAAAVLILTSQLPTSLGVLSSGSGVFGRLLWTLRNPGEWDLFAIALSALTLLLVLGGKRISRLFPGVLLAVVAGIGSSLLGGYSGPTIGEVGTVFPTPSLNLPWSRLPDLLLGGVVIAVIGFAEPAAIARSYAREGRHPWDPNRELIGQGIANLASGLFQAFPVGGSFTRSSLNKLAGATSRWSGLVTGLVALAFLPFAKLLIPLPQAVLSAIVLAAAVSLFQPQQLLKYWRLARLQALTAYATFILTLVLAPRIDQALIIGIGLAVAAHLYREMQLGIDVKRDGEAIIVELSGVLWFASTNPLETAFRNLEIEGVQSLTIDASGLGRVDLSGILLLEQLMDNLRSRGLEVSIIGLKDHMERVRQRVNQREEPPG